MTEALELRISSVGYLARRELPVALRVLGTDEPREIEEIPTRTLAEAAEIVGRWLRPEWNQSMTRC